ncbi:holin [Clostridium sp. Sa3CUN1]|uniref:Holin n=1 Tax=Clostridium gallinarum TaxID=2762246 RepID=A0ABR8Q5J4_9CLOT|nr:phage holin [Clostridium gallinarum]MBD7915688.1 holin [Clostridium gallinarum]
MKFDWTRFKNYGLWVSVLALIPMILSSFGVKVVPEEYQAISNTILAILVALGIISNPTTQRKWYSDDKDDSNE